MKICFYCDKEINPDQEKYFVGLDIPYINLIFHRICYKSIPDLPIYIEERKDDIYKLKNSTEREEFKVGRRAKRRKRI